MLAILQHRAPAESGPLRAARWRSEMQVERDRGWVNHRSGGRAAPRQRAKERRKRCRSRRPSSAASVANKMWSRALCHVTATCHRQFKSNQRQFKIESRGSMLTRLRDLCSLQYGHFAFKIALYTLALSLPPLSRSYHMHLTCALARSHPTPHHHHSLKTPSSAAAGRRPPP